MQHYDFRSKAGKRKTKPGHKTRAENSQRGNPNHGKPQRAKNKRRGAEIDPSRFVNEAVATPEAKAYAPRHSFADFAFSDELKRNITAHGYTAPTEIQDASIKPILAGKDLIGLANTGTGKTAAFVLPIIELLHSETVYGTALIITPTRELANQIDDEFHAFARGLGLKSALCVGGNSINKQIAALKRNPRIVIGTPGRLKDLMNQRKLPVRGTELLVLDEADRMLDMGFVRDVQAIAAELARDRQTLCFSATMTPPVKKLMHEFLADPVTVSVRKSETNDHIDQQVISADSRAHKIEILSGLLKQPEFEKVLVFARTKHGAQRLADKLSKQGLMAHAIHGNKSQSQRERSLAAFKDDRARILVATDVASRGLDIPAVSHVINFDQPETYDDYIHRIGRTGRAGNGGNALTFVGDC